MGYKKLVRSSLLNPRIYATYEGGGNSKSLSGLCRDLLSEQKMSWQDLQEGYTALKNVKERTLPCRGFSVRLQYNPGRMKSSAAIADKRDGNERPCFLCLDHLPEAQKGILYQGQYLILCNPMPVFSSHFTVSHLDHRPQAIGEHIDTFTRLMTDLSSGWAVLYNGPKCGASAPDHLHFQIVPSGQMPVEREILEEGRLTQLKRIGGVSLCCARGLRREAVILEGDDPMVLERAFKRFLEALKKVLVIDEEPMMNIAGFHREMKWYVFIFPRKKHRPEAFFREGNDRVLVSPGAIDMGGLLITPVEKDFERLDATTVEGIYSEVSLESQVVKKAIDALR
jgi:hypothetical protein